MRPWYFGLPKQQRRKQVEHGQSVLHWLDLNLPVTNQRFNFDGEVLRVLTAPRGYTPVRPVVRFDKPDSEPFPLLYGVKYSRPFRDLFFTVGTTTGLSEDTISGDQFLRMFIGSAGHDMELPDYAVRQRAFFSSRVTVTAAGLNLIVLRSDRGLADPRQLGYGWFENAVSIVNRGPDDVLVTTSRQHLIATGVGHLEPGDTLNFRADEFANQTGLQITALTDRAELDIFQIR
jgi:hypothetical protein